ncbi:16S rRNA (adenine(1518)-N(6)/adenine(1519)-N(6))-dimethyltransferase [Anoxybacter fermentans]|uniref:Ribosomal RNA small subunit methyltransferase A n=1 Tax=Anoxybacter fermentans TaxID=1323375 RepID=A0A3Q9HSQ7_9FIRM|nr:16S rRNA (adenine(1518)-N(6)/adenine(1519)-N(6))-dimethyltransferase RsmA [Anoxybacter fermentans]AZR74439.1 16S rRNA (adenine(1518)-N(6)/adenine(1519)-N(6))-dimethyltransferase [Anoxybacter fermentans]
MEKVISTPGKTREILQKFNLQPNKALGQNFLIDNNILNKIIKAGEVTKKDHVIEIGPGIGSLTQRLAEMAGKVTVIEKDRRLIPVLKEILHMYDNINYIEDDVLKVDWSKIIGPGEKIKVIANLPYYITTPIIMGLLENCLPVDIMVFMVQKEVAERMVAEPGGKDYGALSIAVQFYSKAEIVAIVPPTVFIPRPKVNSAIIKLTRLEKPAVDVLSEEIFFKVVKASFQQRRKTLGNSLSRSSELPLSKVEIKEALKVAGIDPSLRGEKLRIEDFGRLSDEIYQRIQQK